MGRGSPPWGANATLGERLPLSVRLLKGMKGISKSPTLAGHNRSIRVRRPLPGRGSLVLEVDLYRDDAPDLVFLPKCYNGFTRKGSRLGGLVPQRSEGATLPISESSTDPSGPSNSRQAVSCEVGPLRPLDPALRAVSLAAGGVYHRAVLAAAISVADLLRTAIDGFVL